MSNGYTHEDDKELLDLLIQDLDANFALLVKRYGGLCHYKAKTWRGNSDEDAKDITQNVFLKAFNALQKGPSVDNLRGWLMTIVLHECVNFERMKGKLQVIPLDAIHEQITEDITGKRPENFVLTAERYKHIANSIESLPIKDQEIICHYYLEELNIPAIQARYYPGTSLNTLKGRLRRAMAKLRSNLGE